MQKIYCFFQEKVSDKTKSLRYGYALLFVVKAQLSYAVKECDVRPAAIRTGL